MIWLTWRQFRAHAVAVYAGLAVLAIALAATGSNLAHAYATGTAACAATDGGCSGFANGFVNGHQGAYFGLIALVLGLPVVIGLFWGAPLLTREFEAGTQRLVWNQSVTRTRWLAVKLGVTGLAATAATALLSLAVNWWSSPIDKAAAHQTSRFSPLLFDARGIVPIGYAAFAFVLGVTAGMLIRRTVPAMAVTLAVFVVVQVAIPLGIRPHLISPAREVSAITAANLREFMRSGGGGPIRVTVAVKDTGAWILSNETIDASGHVVRGISVPSGACTPVASPARGDHPLPRSCFEKIAQLGYRQRVVYQPGGRYWAFQWCETAVFLALTLALTGICFWRIRRLP